MPATVSAERRQADTRQARAGAAAPRSAARASHGRWLREARGILAMAVAGFAARLAGGLRSGACIPPSRGPASVRSAPGWAGRCSARSATRASCCRCWWRPGGSRRSCAARARAAGSRWPASRVLVLARGGPAAAASDTFVAQRVTQGGILPPAAGWAGRSRVAFEHARPGRDLAAAARDGAGRRAAASPRPRTSPSPGSSRPRLRQAAPAARRAGGVRRVWRRSPRCRAIAAEPDAEVEPALPVVVEPSLPRGRAHGAGPGLAGDVRLRQGRRAVVPAAAGGTARSRRPRRGAAPHARGAAGQRRDPASASSQDFEVDGRIVQVSPGPIITSYEFEPAAGREGEPGRESLRRPGAGPEGGVRAHHRARSRAAARWRSRCPTTRSPTVYLREIFVSAEFAESKGKLPLALGKDVHGQAGGRRSHGHAAPADRRRHRQRQDRSGSTA